VSTVRVNLSEMAARALAAADDFRPDRNSLLLSRAVRFYLDERDGGREGWRYPSFLDDGDGGDGEQLVLDEDLWRELRAEAASQDVDPERLLQHAAFYFAAARDEGRLTERIAEELRREMEANGEMAGG
jgi:hypothetical protein